MPMGVIAVGVYGPRGAFIGDARLAGWNVPIANVSFVGAEVLLDKLGACAPGCLYVSGSGSPASWRHAAG
jgi:hypothetical protein